MKVVTIINQKGGVGKTTSVKELGIGLSRLGKKVLLIDLDPQKNLSNRFKIGEQEKNIMTLLKGESHFKDTIKTISEKLDIVPGTNTLSLMRFLAVPSREVLLQRKFIKESELLSEYDYILIDVNADFGDYSFNALSVSNKVYIPIQVEGMALEGVNVLLTGLEFAKEISDFTIERVFCTMLDGRIKKHTENADDVKNFFKEKTMNTIIRRNAAIDAANTDYTSVFDTTGTTGFEDYMNFIIEFINIEEGNRLPVSEVREKLKKGD